MATKSDAFKTQVGGDHYTKLAIQPITYSMANHLDALQHTAVKYITRFKDKDGLKDLNKAQHCIDMLIETYYPVPAPEHIDVNQLQNVDTENVRQALAAIGPSPLIQRVDDLSIRIDKAISLMDDVTNEDGIDRYSVKELRKILEGKELEKSVNDAIADIEDRRK